MEDFQREARLVAGGHTTETPAAVTDASNVSRESVRIALTLAAINNWEVKTAGIENAYLTPLLARRSGAGWDPNLEPMQLRRQLLYALCMALSLQEGASFCNHVADCMRHLGWQSCKVDQDVWLKPEVRNGDGYQYYVYCLLYVDGILIVHHNGVRMLKEIDRLFKTKAGSICDPEF